MQYEQLTFKLEVQDNASAKFDALGAAAKAAGDKGQAAGEKMNLAFAGARMSSMGRGLISFAQTGVRALDDLITASSDLYEAQNFTKQIFGDSEDAIHEFARTAAKEIGESARTAEQGASQIGIFGRAVGLAGDDLVGFSENLVTLSSDMASVKNTTPERAITAIGAAFRGQYRPIKEFGVILNEQVLKNAAFAAGIYDGSGKLTQQQKVLAVNAELFKQLDFAQGDYQRTQEQVANQQRQFNAELENAKAALGDSLRPAMIKGMEAANAFLDIIMKIPQPVKEIASTIGVAVVGFAALAGGLLFVGGKVLSAVGNFQKLTTALGGMEGGLGKAAGGFAKFAGIAAVEMVAIQAAAEGINAISGEAKKAGSSFEDFGISLKKGDIEGTLQSFGHMAEHSDKTLKGFLGLGGILEDAGRSFSVAGVKYKANIEDWDRSFDKILAKSPEDAAGLLEALQKSSDGLDKNSQQYKDQMDMIDRYTPKLKKAVDTQLSSGDATKLSTDLMAKYADKALIPAEESMNDLTGATDEFNKMLDTLTSNLDEAESSFDTAGERADTFKSALDAATGPTERVMNISAIHGSIMDLVDGFKNADGAMDHSLTTLDSWTEAGRNNLSAVDDLASKIQTDLVRAYKDSGGSASVVTDYANKYTDELKWQMAQAGATSDEIDAYIKTLHLTPQDISTAIKIEDDELAKQKLSILKLDMEAMPDEISTQIMAALDENDFTKAYDIASGWIKSEGAINTDVKPVADMGAAATEKGQLDYYYSQHPIQAPVKFSFPDPDASARAYAKAVGKPVGLAQYGATPSSAAMQSMGLSSVGGTLMAAPAPVTAGSFAPTSTTSVFNISINMPTGTNEVRTVDAIRQFARSNGRTMVGARGRSGRLG
jgi:hypothetical protein